MKTIKAQNFNNQKIILDGFAYTDCTFRACTIIYSATEPFALVGNAFYDCLWSFEGPAANTLHFLRSMYKDMGEVGRQMVDLTFENIKK